MARAANRVRLRHLMGGRVGVVLPVRVARVGRLDEVKRAGLAVHAHGDDGMSGPPLVVRGLALEVEAEARSGTSSLGP